MKTMCGTILAAVLVAGTAFSAAVETTPVPRQSVDTWGWWRRCGDIHNHLVKEGSIEDEGSELIDTVELIQ